MALYYDLPVFKDVYKLILLIFEYTKDFPKQYLLMLLSLLLIKLTEIKRSKDGPRPVGGKGLIDIIHIE